MCRLAMVDRPGNALESGLRNQQEAQHNLQQLVDEAAKASTVDQLSGRVQTIASHRGEAAGMVASGGCQTRRASGDRRDSTAS